MFLIPIGHEQHRFRRLPWVTIAIAAICVVLRIQACSVEDAAKRAFLDTARARYDTLRLVGAECVRKNECPDDVDEIASLLRDKRIGDPAQQELFALLDANYHEELAALPSRRLGVRPAEVKPLSLITYMFAHGSLEHLLGNLLILYLMGVAIEERWGRLRFLALYLVGGVVSAFGYIAMHLGEQTPLVGASGALAATMGAFLALHATAKIRFFYFVWIAKGTFEVPAWIVLPLWFLQQLVSIEFEEGVAYSAHAAGFAFGLVVAGVIRVVGLDRRFKHAADVASGEDVEDLDFEDAEQLAARGANEAALTKALAARARHPDRFDITELTHTLARRTGDATTVAACARHTFARWSSREPARVLDDYRWLAARRDVALGEDLLDHVLTAAAARGDLDAAQDVMRRLFADHRAGVRYVRALWVIAELHASRGRPEAAAPFLRRIVEEQPDSVWADRARERLAS